VSAQPRLIVRSHGRSLGEYPLSSGTPVGIGRSVRNAIVLEDLAVSRRHAEFVLNETAGERWVVVRDLGSRNGLWLRGARIDQGALHAGDVVQIGDGTFEVQFDDPLAEPAEAETVYAPRPAAVPPAASPTPTRDAILVIIAGPGTGQTIKLDRNVIPLGPRYAPSRAAVRRVSGRYLLTRLWGDEVPTVNGEPMTQRTRVLVDDDVIAFADRTLRFLI
jgi:hypothetical protein